MSRNCCRFLEVTSQPYLMPGTAVYCLAGSKSLGRGLEHKQHYKGRAPQEHRHMPRKMPNLQFLKESLWHPICTSCMFTSDYYQVITVVQNKTCNHPNSKCCSHSLFLKSCIYQSCIYSAFKVTFTCWLIYLTQLQPKHSMLCNTSSTQATTAGWCGKQCCCWKPYLGLGISSAQQRDISDEHSIFSSRLSVFKGSESVQKTWHL